MTEKLYYTDSHIHDVATANECFKFIDKFLHL